MLRVGNGDMNGKELVAEAGKQCFYRHSTTAVAILKEQLNIMGLQQPQAVHGFRQIDEYCC